MKNNFFNYFKSGILVSVIGALVIALYLAKSHWELSIAISGTVTMLLVLISKYLWKFKPFKWLFWVDDFSGRYEGVLRYQYIDDQGNFQSGERKHVKVINQNGSRISIASFTLNEDGEKSSPSYSRGMFIELTEDENHYQIIYHFLNEGNPQLGFPPHFGTDVLKFIKNGTSKKLTGGYYTNRNPQTRGEYFNLKWVSNDLSHEF
ncbi:hypothetical protein L3049_06440 [Labilibaculum sp. DW002]|uniref:CD-NTase-associated protein 15 domain-containing protein n=1 Tax=Paralabilibaculum antarcticum TaxID=2912572 RepID=A0ABT5VT00_9BACT|nr:hypothetical protein [Labilibaculum sp. DW002]MDE5417643.1 hypothetical protein [Labilibaculum sp. DW002]